MKKLIAVFGISFAVLVGGVSHANASGLLIGLGVAEAQQVTQTVSEQRAKKSLVKIEPAAGEQTQSEQK